MNSVVRVAGLMTLALAALLGSPLALAVDSGDVILVSRKGEVHITVNGVASSVRAGGVLELPATLRTGRDGAVELKQGATTVSVGPETLLEFPALEKRGAPIDRIVQPRGNAFYNIGKRDGRKLRVETPYLVGVIKGTQFNVAALDESTTISLFEGLLEVHATDESAVVDLKAGEIASRKRGDKSITIMKMDGSKAPSNAPRAPAGSGSNNGTPGPAAPRTPATHEGGVPQLVDRGGAVGSVVSGVVDRVSDTSVTADATASVSGASGADVSVNAAANVGNVVETGANAAVSVGASGVDATVGTRVDAGPVSVDATTAANVGGGSVDISTSTNVSAGPVGLDTSTSLNVGSGSVDVATNTNVNAGPIAVDTSAAVDLTGSAADVTTSTRVDAGPVAADLGTSTSVDLTGGTVDATTTTSVDAGPLTTDVGTAAAVDLGAGTVAAGADALASTPVAVVDVGASAVVDVAAGTVDLGLSVAGADIDLGLDLGLDDSTDTTPETDSPGTDTTTPGNVVDVGGLLDGLLRRPGRK